MRMMRNSKLHAAKSLRGPGSKYLYCFEFKKMHEFDLKVFKNEQKNRCYRMSLKFGSSFINFYLTV